MPTGDDGASPAVCPRCGRVGVDCEDKAAVERAVKYACKLSCDWPQCDCAWPDDMMTGIRLFLGCPAK